MMLKTGMPSAKSKIIRLASTAFLLLINALICVFSPSYILQKTLKLQINDTARFDGYFRTRFISISLIIIIILLYPVLKDSGLYRKIAGWLHEAAMSLLRLVSFKTLLIVTSFYVVILFIIGVKNYDLGADEVTYLTSAKSFSMFLFPLRTINGTIFGGSFYLIDNFAILPFYVISTILFKLNLTAVWHFKLLSALLTTVTLTIVSYIIYRLYDFRYTAIFLFLLAMLPSFGSLGTSANAEIYQASFFFAALYLWMKEGGTLLTTKRVLLIGLLFSLVIHSKFQILPILTVSLLIYRLVAPGSKSIMILAVTLVITSAIGILRLIPVYFYDPKILVEDAKFWTLLAMQEGNSLIFNLQKLQLLDRFASIFFISTILLLAYPILKTSFEKFIYIFTVSAFVWFVFFFNNTTYRNLYFALLPFSFLCALVILGYMPVKAGNMFRTVAALLTFFVFLWGASANFIYAFIGFNDGVQFDLDGNRNRLFYDIKRDNSQREFYEEIKNYVTPSDTVFIGTGGQSFFTTQFYMPENPSYDFEHFVKSLDENSSKKFIIIDRVSFPLGIETGQKKLDSLKLNKILLLKKNEYELYSASK